MTILTNRTRLAVFVQDTDPAEELHEDFSKYFTPLDSSESTPEGKISYITTTDFKQIERLNNEWVYYICLVVPAPEHVDEWIRDRFSTEHQAPEFIEQFKVFLNAPQFYFTCSKINILGQEAYRDEAFIKALRSVSQA